MASSRLDTRTLQTRGRQSTNLLTRSQTEGADGITGQQATASTNKADASKESGKKKKKFSCKSLPVRTFPKYQPAHKTMRRVQKGIPSAWGQRVTNRNVADKQAMG